MSYLTVSSDDVLNSTNNETEFPELTKVLEEHFDMKFQEGFILKYTNLKKFQSLIDLSVDQTDNIIELVNECN